MIEESLPRTDWNTLPLPLLGRRQLVAGGHGRVRRAAARPKLLNGINLFGYGQVESPYGTGQFLHDVEEAFREDERVVDLRDQGRATGSTTRSAQFLGKGR